MKEVYWILDGMLAGRRGPEEVAWDLQELWDGGFRTIVSLAGGHRDAVRAAGFRHYSIFLNGGLAVLPVLRRVLVGKMLPVVDFVAGEVAAGRPTLVHCRQGRDRTGAVLAGYLIRYEGLSPQEAIRRLREANPEALASPGFDRLPRFFTA